VPKRTSLITKNYNVAVSGPRIFPYTRSKRSSKRVLEVNSPFAEVHVSPFSPPIKGFTNPDLYTWRSWIRASWYNYENDQQDALYRLIYYSKSDLHVSGDVFAHHQEHLTVFTVYGSVRPSCCQLVSWMSWNWTISVDRRVNTSGALDCIYIIW
jgi:hypothetical protein